MIDLTANFPAEIRKPTSWKFEVSNMFSGDVNFKKATYIFIKNSLSGSLILGTFLENKVL